MILACLFTGILWTLQGSGKVTISNFNGAFSSRQDFYNCPQLAIVACSSCYGFISTLGSLLFLHMRLTPIDTKASRKDNLTLSEGSRGVEERHLWLIGIICQLLPALALNWSKDYVITQIPRYTSTFVVFSNTNAGFSDLFIMMIIWVTYVDLATLSRLIIGMW